VTSVMCGRHRIRRGYPRTQVPLCVPTQLAPIDGRRQREVDYNALGTRTYPAICPARSGEHMCRYGRVCCLPICVSSWGVGTVVGYVGV
jgi:hypothetical protein